MCFATVWKGGSCWPNRTLLGVLGLMLSGIVSVRPLCPCLSASVWVDTKVLHKHVAAASQKHSCRTACHWL